MTEELCKLKLLEMLRTKHKVTLSFMSERDLKRLVDDVYKVCSEDFQRDTSRG